MYVACRRFLSRAQLEIHEEKCRGLGEVVGAGLTQDDLVFKCNICFAQFSDYQRVQEHLGRHKELASGGGQVGVLSFGIFHQLLFLQVVISIEGGSKEDVFTEEITTFVISIDGDANDSELEVTDRVMKYTLVEYLNLS